MIEPRRIGRFLGVDQFGYVKPDVAISRIGAIWKPLIVFVCDALMNRRGVRSVYLRGSIPRGLAIENVSDADFMYFSEIAFDKADLELEKAIEAKFPFVKGLELSRLDHATLWQNPRSAEAALLSHAAKDTMPIPCWRRYRKGYRAVPDRPRDGQSRFFIGTRFLAITAIAGERS